ncbi:PhoP family transcriptional regulator [Enterococcus silesiacus]|uniref:PhoP family transcriptional regulator n=1 Tax=Enterococcus silesiacus TaxID=332949 RepID=A0A0S3KAD4_9ENTE|nr:winged helix-turn-helix domain-containing protein [Enterococcus silesiacus]ALS01186.1 PhoP family transcriptional regulator [Enterococcus silesiacus]OJG92582.1 hypothetical protein RV15_GL003007 [Enterococcus silesiacus]
MYTIGYISFEDRVSEGYKELFTPLQSHIQIIEKKHADQLFEHDSEVLHQIDTLVIENSGLNELNWICELIMNIRKQATVPLWILASSEHVNRTNRIVYLQLGADGIIDQANETDQSILMMRNLMRRFRNREQYGILKETSRSKMVEFKLIPQNLSVCLENGKEVNLTKLEFLTIEYLHKHARKTMTYEEIYQSVWNDTYHDRKYRVSNLIFHLRQKLEVDIEKPKYIKTVRSKGYMLNI